MVEVTRCISDRAQCCYWELEYKWCVSTGTARYGGLHFHDQFYQTAPLGATPQMGWIASRVGGWRNPPNCYDPSPVLKKALFCVLQCKKTKKNKQTQQQQKVPVPAALNHYAMITSAKVNFSSGSLQVKNAHLIPAVGSKRLESAAKHLQVDRKLVCVCVCVAIGEDITLQLLFWSGCSAPVLHGTKLPVSSYRGRQMWKTWPQRTAVKASTTCYCCL